MKEMADVVGLVVLALLRAAEASTVGERALVVGGPTLEARIVHVGEGNFSEENGCTSLPDLPASRRQPVGAYVGSGKVFLCGGQIIRGYGVSSTCFGLNLAAAVPKWAEESAHLNVPRKASQGAILSDGRGWALIGGWGAQELPMEIYREEDGAFFPSDHGPPLTLHFHCLSAARDPSNGGQLLVVTGGVNSAVNVNAGLRSTYIYDVNAETWSRSPDMPGGPRHFHSCGTARGTLAVVVGGHFQRTDAEILDLATGQWKIGPVYPEGHAKGASAPHRNTFLVYGGRGSSSVYKFDPVSLHWELVGDLGQAWFKQVVIPLPDDLHLGCQGERGERALLVGGERTLEARIVHVGEGNFGGEEENGCTSLPDLPSIRRQPVGAYFAGTGKVLVCGGQLRGTIDVSSGCFGLNLAALVPTWAEEESARLLAPRKHAQAAILDNGKGWVVMGGRGAEELPTEIYKEESDAFSPAANPLPVVLHFHCLAVARDPSSGGQVLVVTGGTKYRGDVLIGSKSTYIYNINDDTWTQSADMPGGKRATHSCGTVRGNTVVVVGGFNGRADAEIFDLATETWTAGPEYPEPHSQGASAQYRDTFLVYGGRDSSSVYKFDPASMDWELAGDLGKIWFKHVVIPLPDDLDLGCPATRVCGHPPQPPEHAAEVESDTETARRVKSYV